MEGQETDDKDLRSLCLKAVLNVFFSLQYNFAVLVKLHLMKC